MTEQEQDRDVVAMLRKWAIILRDVKPAAAAKAEQNANNLEAMIDEDVN